MKSLLLVPPVLGGLVGGLWMHSFMWFFAGIGVGTVADVVILIAWFLVVMSKFT